MPKQIPSLKAQMLSYLARREYTRAELKNKMLAWFAKQAQKKQTKDDTDSTTELCETKLIELEQALNEFETRGWISEQRAVESLISQKFNKLGSLRLKQELKSKGVETQLLQATLEKIQKTELARAINIWECKFKEFPENSKTYAKQSRFLLYRGFSADIVKKVLAGNWMVERDD